MTFFPTRRRSPRDLSLRPAAAVRPALLAGSLVAVCLLVSAGRALAVPSATLTITETNRSASASGGPFFVPNQAYTAALVLGLSGAGDVDSFTCDALANPCFEVQLEVALPGSFAWHLGQFRSRQRTGKTRRPAGRSSPPTAE